MSVGAKICGLNDEASVAAVAAGGALYAGFVFYAKSPRAVTPERAAELISALPPSVAPVALVVNASDAELDAILNVAPVRILQLHGQETPERLADIKRRTGLEVWKAVGIASAADGAAARAYEDAADKIMLDAKPTPGGLPGGNARVFDWALVRALGLRRPWLLAGGLKAANLGEAVAATGARLVDVSSGVEDAPGVKNPIKIAAFLDLARRLETSC